MRRLQGLAEHLLVLGDGFGQRRQVTLELLVRGGGAQPLERLHTELRVVELCAFERVIGFARTRWPSESRRGDRCPVPAAEV